MNSSSSTSGAVIALVVGALFVAIALVQLVASTTFARTAQRAQGEVVALNAGPAHPQVRFTTSDGQTVEFPQGGFVSQAVGDRVEVLYDPAHPHDAVVDAFGARFGFPSLELAAGLAGLAAGATTLIRRRRASTP